MPDQTATPSADGTDATRRTRAAAVVVLAAGQGTRMRSRTPKVMHRVGGRSLLGHAVAAAAPLADEVVVVVRHEREAVAAHAAEVGERLGRRVVVADQDEVPGTGRALWCGLQALDAAREADGLPRLTGPVLVTSGDVPLVTTDSLQALLGAAADAPVALMTAVLDDATGYGRVVRDEAGQVRAVVEHKDADEAVRAVREVNGGLWALDLDLCRDVLPGLGAANAQGEQYLTDVVAEARARGLQVAGVPVADAHEVDGVNDRVQLAEVGALLNRRTLHAHMRAGVTVVDPVTTWVDVDVVLEPDVTLLPGTQLHDGTVVRAGASVGPDTTLSACEVGEGASVVRSHGSGAVLAAGATVGPFAYLRPGTDLGEGGKLGAFVETKNARIGAGSKVPHLSYVGDATIGTGSNIGCATVFVNYDGVHKHRTTVGDHVRIGSDTMLVAPVTVGDGAYTAASTVVRKDVPPGALAMTVAPQRNVDGWVEERRPGSAAAEASARARAAAAREQSTTEPGETGEQGDPR
ncbi:bifunctional UDP-N-acetylglucosamine diphosphorylase/glucosamine-1-phosphate N-acetyltransferase GlmU [Aquipuribacter sp. SD81]|uniref:bifunctional UDP-N-acetylglucosamine diphosphorylase/glucosamine-1-phosphate N-acetyltransferase GlmU n=1 Tax=Aquipuribacter sp. SD81 TaxID=3127703 RepID=UPI0030171D59